MNIVMQESLDDLMGDLFAFLDDSITSVQRMLEQLTQLRAAVIRRDEKTLTQMLGDVREQEAQKAHLQRRQQQISSAFSARLDCRPEDFHISYLAEHLEGDLKKTLKTKQQTLRQLATRLSLEHRATERLLRECMHMNRKLLECIVGKTSPALTYGQGGRIQRETQSGLMSLRM